MIRGLYTSAWSMLANTKQMDTITNNLANLNTTAYKRDTVVFEAFPQVLAKRVDDGARSSLNPSGNVGSMSLGSDIGQVFTYYKQGSLQKTDNEFDLAIENSDTGFFKIGIPQEDGTMKEYYTRDGSFSLNINKKIVTREGYLLMGEKGPITINGKLTVEDDGSIYDDEKQLGKLAIKDFSNPDTLRKSGNNLVEITSDTKEQPFSGSLRQGFVEDSNVNSIKEMVGMINVMRAYEANQKILQQQDNILSKAVSEIGAVK